MDHPVFVHDLDVFSTVVQRQDEWSMRDTDDASYRVLDVRVEHPTIED